KEGRSVCCQSLCYVGIALKNATGCRCPGQSTQTCKKTVVKHIVWILLLCPAAGAVGSPTGQAKHEPPPVQLEKPWARAPDEHDTKALSCILADEFEGAGPDGKLTDRSVTLAKARTAGTVHHQSSDLHAHVHGDFAYIRGVADGITPAKLNTRVRFTDIYVYREGRWQCVAGHESLVSPASP